VLKSPLPAADEEVLWRFRREVHLQSQLDDIHVVKILDFDLEATPPWFVMPKAHTTLQDALPTLAAPSGLKLFREAAAGVAYAHRNRVIHRDLKPSNILLFLDAQTGMYRAAVADFGLG